MEKLNIEEFRVLSKTFFDDNIEDSYVNYLSHDEKIIMVEELLKKLKLNAKNKDSKGKGKIR